MKRNKLIMRTIAILMSIVMIFGINIELGSMSRAEEPQYRFGVVDTSHGVAADIEYRFPDKPVAPVTVDPAMADEGGCFWITKEEVFTISVKVKLKEGHDLTNVKFNGVQQPPEAVASDITSLLGSGWATTIDTTESNQLILEFDGAGSGGPGPGPGPGSREPLSVSINGINVYDGNTLTEPADVNYDVTMEEDHGETVLVISPKHSKYEASNQREDDKAISEYPIMEVGYIEATGSGTVLIKAGDNYEVPGGHKELVVPVEVAVSSNGYSFKGTEGTKFKVDNGSFNSKLTLKGSVCATEFSMRDLKYLTVGSDAAPVNLAFEAPLSDGQRADNSSVEIEGIVGGEYDIYAETAFKNINNIRALDEANIVVTLKGDTPKALENANNVFVQTGGSVEFKSNQAISTDDVSFQAGYYNEIGQILDLPSDGRMEDKVKYVGCVVGDFSDKEGRYEYRVSEDKKNILLKSTTRALYSLGYRFGTGNGDQSVINGDFKIEAGSGLKRAGITAGGEYWFEAGTEVKFTLLPNPGCKYKDGSFKFNGNGSADVVKPQSEPGVYIFTMPSNPIHVSCEFVEADNTADVKETKAVESATITVPASNIAGTLEMNIKDTELKDAQKEAFEKLADGSTIETVLDINLNQKIDKIGTNESWEKPVTDLTKEGTVVLALDESLLGSSEYQVIREHNGKTEALETTFDEKTGTISFKTNGFSTYAIAKSGALAIGGQKQKLAERIDKTGIPENAKIYYKITDATEKKRATVNKKTGVLTPKKTGTVHVTVYYKLPKDKKEYEITVLELNVVVPKMDKFNKDAVRFEGATVSANELFKNDEGDVIYSQVIAGQEYEWKSSKEGVATVDQSGLVTAKASGKTMISLTITNKDGSKKIFKTALTVKLPKVKNSITLKKKSKKITVANIVNYDIQSAGVKWTSLNPEFATVTPVEKAGKIVAEITPVSTGKTTVIVTIEGKDYPIEVTVS